MRKYIVIFLIFSLFRLGLYGQVVPGKIAGKVSFLSPPNIYVKFISTAGISAGDTLFVMSGEKLIPALKVSSLSSTSCVCTSVQTAKIEVGSSITAVTKSTSKTSEVKTNANQAKEVNSQNAAVASEKKQIKPDERKQLIRGSISAYSYTDFTNSPGRSSTRFRYTFNLDAANIADSKFSIESYISFSHKLGDWALVKSDLFSALKVYALGIRYDLNKTTQISLGRRINQKMSSIGAMDGLQIEKSFNRFSLGLLAGTRPDFTNYGFNSKLFQYGGYLAYSKITPDVYNETSLAFMQQTNNGKTDRRFLYFQHSNSLIKNLYFLGTFELDLYRLKTDSLKKEHPLNTFNPTGLYLYLRYKMTENLTISGSYDARKNVIYYETYKSFIDRILETELRQGFRLQANYRITPYVTVGIQSGYRFIKSDVHPSRNIYGYLTYNQIPGLKMSLTLSGTYLESSYLNSKILGVSLSRDLLRGMLQTSIGYRYVDYVYPESTLNTVQNIGEVGLFWLFTRKMSFSVNYEGSFLERNKYNMLFLQLRRRF